MRVFRTKTGEKVRGSIDGNTRAIRKVMRTGRGRIDRPSVGIAPHRALGARCRGILPARAAGRASPHGNPVQGERQRRPAAEVAIAPLS
jgi:hypothetical protein